MPGVRQVTCGAPSIIFRGRCFSAKLREGFVFLYLLSKCF